MARFRITVELTDAGPGDADALHQDIADQLSEGWDPGDYTLRMSQVVGGNAFARDPGDDVLPEPA